ncbi:MAG: amidase [Alphaproteobacteria bacterium]|nr:amidase [Alphaproteobacteria bacterium]
MDDLWTLTASQAVAKIEHGEITSEALVRSCLARINDVDGEIQAWAYLDPDAAIKQAQELDRGPRRGPIHGIPFGLKDIIETRDMPTGYGSPIYDGHRPAWDAPCVAACRLAGGVVMGKTVTTEFAHRHPGKTRNPHNSAHTPGGSSSGSAAAVGARMVPVAFGTQTTGSTIRPAAYCGTVGYKPSYGDFNLTGVRDNTPSFDTLGLISRGVEDLALFRAAVMALDVEELSPVAISDLRIGLCRTAFWDRADTATHTLLEDTAKTLSDAGASVSDFALPDGEASLPDVVRKVSGFEFARVMLHERITAPDKLSKVLLEGRVADGLNCSYDDYRTAEQIIKDYRRRLYAAQEGFDLLLTPSAPGEPPEGLSTTGDAIFNNVWTTTHVPALTLPVATGPQGLPLGVQLIGQLHGDSKLLSAGKAVYALLSDAA